MSAAVLRLFLCAAVLFTATAGAQDEEDDIKIEPIPQAPGAFLEKDYLKEERAWQERCLLKPAQKRWEGQPWAAEATKLLQDTFAREADDTAVLPDLAKRSRELLKQSGDDPLIACAGASILKEYSDDWREAPKVLDRVYKTAPLTPAFIECWALTQQIAMLGEQAQNPATASDQLMKAATRAISDDSYDAEAEAVFVRQQMRFINAADPEKAEPMLAWQKALKSSRWPEWVKLTLTGMGEVKLAWIKRSNAGGGAVKEDQWEGFQKHLATARDLLQKAYDMRPDRPEAATELITVSMGEGVDYYELRDWFNCAVEAQFDYAPAYKQILWALRPRWSGSWTRMILFGKVCAETKRYDTGVPAQLMIACMDVASEIGMASESFANELVKDAVIEMSQGYLKAAADVSPTLRVKYCSWAALSAWLAQDNELAARALKEAGGRLDAASAASLQRTFLHEGLMQADIASATGGFGPDVQQIVKAPASVKKDIDVTKLSPEGECFVRDWAERMNFTAELEKGDWVPLLARLNLTNFYQTGGRWSAEQDGTLVAHGTDGKSAQALWRIPIDGDVEVRADVTVETPGGAEEPTAYSFGPVLRNQPRDTHHENGAWFSVFNERGKKLTGRVINSPAASPEVPVKPTEEYHLHATVAKGRFSFQVNGEPIVKSATQQNLRLPKSTGAVGFGVRFLPKGCTLKIRNLAVRRVAKDKAP